MAIRDIDPSWQPCDGLDRRRKADPRSALGIFSANVVDENDTALPGSTLTTLTLTLGTP